MSRYTQIAFLFFLIIKLPLQAQWVPIPTSFATYIHNYIDSTAVTNNTLDTTNVKIRGLKNLSIYSNSAADITGIQYFDSLINLYASCPITIVPVLPPMLKTFEVHATVASVVSPLPFNLTALKFYNAVFATLAVPLPLKLNMLVLNQCAQLTTLPVLPDSLKWLEAKTDLLITTLPTLPTGLTHLDLDGSSNAVFSAALPTALQYLNASHTAFGPISTFAQSPNLTEFDCSYCTHITSLPGLPRKLINVTVDNCAIATMDSVPRYMEQLDISNNPITSINDLPDTVGTLLMNDLLNLSFLIVDTIYIGNRLSMNNCTHTGNVWNFLTNVFSASWGIYVSASNCNIWGDVPSIYAHLYSLDLSYNQIYSFGFQPCANPNCTQYYIDGADVNLSHCGFSSLYQWGIPNYFNSLDLSYNSLSQISWLPNTYNLNLSNNQISSVTTTIIGNNVELSNNNISCLPYIGDISYLGLMNNPINCLPNLPSVNFNCWGPTTVCAAGNSNNCPLNSKVTGIVFDDINQNTYQDSGEVNLQNRYVQMQPMNFIHLSDTGGQYVFQCPVFTPCTISGLPNLPYRRITTSPYTTTFSGFGLTDYRDIGIYTKPNVNDMMVSIVPFQEPRPGFHQDYYVNAQNIGTTIQNGTVEMYFDPGLFYQSSTPAGAVIGNKIVWSVDSLNPLESFHAYIDFIVSAPVPLGSTVKAGVYAICNLPDTTQYNNHDTIWGIAVGSYDPNNKYVSPPDGLSEEEIANGHSLEFTVRFQNTGTSYAVNIAVSDTLSSAVDLNTFQMVDASHIYSWKIEERVLTVYFDNIFLPDSGSNEQLSHGFFRYRIKPKLGSHAGDQIKNTANIFFDFNPAVVTNTAVADISKLIIQQPQPQYLCSGEPLLLTIRTSPAVKGKQWYKDDMPLGIFSDSIYIDSSTVNDRGFYKCIVSLVNGESYVSKIVGVEVADYSSRPDFSFKFSDVMCVTGNNQSKVSLVINNTGYTHKIKWYINGVLTQPDSYTNLDMSLFYHSNLHDGDSIRCMVSDSIICKGWVTVTRDTILHFTPVYDTARVSILPHAPYVCSNGSLTFTATIANGIGVSWYLNGTLVPYVYGNPVHTFNYLHNNDVIVAKAYSSATYPTCAPILYGNGHDLNTDTVRIRADTSAVPAITIRNNPAVICSNPSLYFTPDLINGGSQKSFIWVKNGFVVSTSYSYTDTTMAVGDQIYCKFITNGCSGNFTDTVVSNIITYPANDLDSIKFTASLTNNWNCTSASFSCQSYPWPAGVSFQWKKNNVDVPGAVHYRDTIYGMTLSDTVYCVMTLPASCGSRTVISNPVVFTAYPLTLNPLADNTICPHYDVWYQESGNLVPGQLISWYKNGVLQTSGITSGTNYSQYRNGTNDTVDYEVYYQFPGSGCYRPYTSNTAHVHVITETVTPQVQFAFDHTAACLGGGVHYSIVVTPSYLQSSIQQSWTLNGAYINPYYLNQSLTNGGALTCRTSLSNTSQFSCIHYTPQVFYSTVSVVQNKPSVDVISNNILCLNDTSKIFKAESVFGGAFPGYQWKKNGVLVGSNSDTYSDSASHNGDWVYCVMTSTNPCPVPARVNSDTIVVTAPVDTPLIRIQTLQTSICEGAQVDFNSLVSRQGDNPTYDWKVNGTTVSSDSADFSYTQLHDNDVVSCVLHSSENCLASPQSISNGIEMQIMNKAYDSVSVTPSTLQACNGSLVEFTANPINGGQSPQFVWKKNGVAVGLTGSYYTDYTLSGLDVVTCELISSELCPEPFVAISNPVSIIIDSVVTPAVHITESGNNLCSLIPILFTSAETNGGTYPLYSWFVNGVDMNTNSSYYSAANFTTGDVVSCQLVSNANCLSQTTANSNQVTVNVVPAVMPQVSITVNPPAVCQGELVTLHANPVYGGAIPVFQWKQNGVAIGTNSPTYSSNTFTANDSISVELYSSESCVIQADINSPSIPLTIYPTPPVPTITQVGNVLVSSIPGYCQWYLNGAPIYGDTTSAIIANLAGWYQVEIVNGAGCSSLSSPFYMASTGVPEIDFINRFIIYPNPSNGPFLNVRLDIGSEVGTLEITNALGQVVLNMDGITSGLFQLDISKLASAVYHVQLKNSHLRFSKKLVISK